MSPQVPLSARRCIRSRPEASKITTPAETMMTGFVPTMLRR